MPLYIQESAHSSVLRDLAICYMAENSTISWQDLICSAFEVFLN